MPSSTYSIRRRPRYQVNTIMRRAKVRQQDVADALGISQTTVSAALTRKSWLSDEMADRIWTEIERAVALASRA